MYLNYWIRLFFLDCFNVVSCDSNLLNLLLFILLFDLFSVTVSLDVLPFDKGLLFRTLLVDDFAVVLTFVLIIGCGNPSPICFCACGLVLSKLT